MLSVVVPEKVQTSSTRREESGFEISARTLQERPEEMGGEKFHAEEVD